MTSTGTSLEEGPLGEIKSREATIGFLAFGSSIFGSSIFSTTALAPMRGRALPLEEAAGCSERASFSSIRERRCNTFGG